MSESPYISVNDAISAGMTCWSPATRLIVTGQIGAGKTTLAQAIARVHGLVHVSIDHFHEDDDPAASTLKAVTAIDGGWVAEANVWQIPDGLWPMADQVIFLDYANAVHCRRILRRCLDRCLRERSLMGIRRVVREERYHLRIVTRFADENREGWIAKGGFAPAGIPVIRCASPREARRLLVTNRR